MIKLLNILSEWKVTTSIPTFSSGRELFRTLIQNSGFRYYFLKILNEKTHKSFSHRSAIEETYIYEDENDYNNNEITILDGDNGVILHLIGSTKEYPQEYIDREDREGIFHIGNNAIHYEL